MTMTDVTRLVVEVLDASDLQPKDGSGSSNPYVLVKFADQSLKTPTKLRSLTPVWNEKLEFKVSKLESLTSEKLQIEVYHEEERDNIVSDRLLGHAQLDKLSQILQNTPISLKLTQKCLIPYNQGMIRLKIYQPDSEIFSVNLVSLPKAEPEPELEVIYAEKQRLYALDGNEEECKTQVTRIQNARAPVGGGSVNSVKALHKPTSKRDKSIGTCTGHKTEEHKGNDQAESEKCLFVRVIKSRGLKSNPSSQYVRVVMPDNRLRQMNAAGLQSHQLAHSPEWGQICSFALNWPESPSKVEISVWDLQSNIFLGGIWLDLSNIAMLGTQDHCGAMAPQWYQLRSMPDDVDDDDRDDDAYGEIQVSIWIGVEADGALKENMINEEPGITNTAYVRPKVYYSPTLWYLRVTVIKAQGIRLVPNQSELTPDIRPKVELGFQCVRGRCCLFDLDSGAFQWNEDLILVAAEPFETESYVTLTLEDHTKGDTTTIVEVGCISIPMNLIYQRFDEHPVAPNWFDLQDASNNFGGRILLSICLEGGYHVLEEATHACSDHRPTAKHLWKPAIGTLKLLIRGACSLLPTKTRGVRGKSSTDAYCVAKYGKKWVRTATVSDSLNPLWNLRHTWQVYDPHTVLTVSVFDNWRMYGGQQDGIIGKVCIRVSALETNKTRLDGYPLFVLSRTGLKKMGEIQLAVRFSWQSLLTETCTLYTQPLLPRMHHLRPLPVGQLEALRSTVVKMVTMRLQHSDPPLGQEVVRYMLEADSHAWSMRKCRTSLFRIFRFLSGVKGLISWLDGIRKWKSKPTTILVHVLYLVLVWFPYLIIPTLLLYVCLIGAWYSRFRQRNPPGMTDERLFQTIGVNPDELDEEFDTIPSARSPETIRARYDRLRIVAARAQTVLGDVVTLGESFQALATWRDPRATRLFVWMCLLTSLLLYTVPPKTLAVALGFYYLRHPVFRDPMPPAALNFFHRIPPLTEMSL